MTHWHIPYHVDQFVDKSHSEGQIITTYLLTYIMMEHDRYLGDNVSLWSPIKIQEINDPHQTTNSISYFQGLFVQLLLPLLLDVVKFFLIFPRIAFIYSSVPLLRCCLIQKKTNWTITSSSDMTTVLQDFFNFLISEITN